MPARGLNTGSKAGSEVQTQSERKIRAPSGFFAPLNPPPIKHNFKYDWAQVKQEHSTKPHATTPPQARSTTTANPHSWDTQFPFPKQSTQTQSSRPRAKSRCDDISFCSYFSDMDWHGFCLNICCDPDHVIIVESWKTNIINNIKEAKLNKLEIPYDYSSDIECQPLLRLKVNWNYI